ncbi:efflux RND transporter periplasmic adaptor subunit [Chondrinema litorale]|uniref:efflux RND transporter periplasmic adaptor subunit n=1 Tax=Chondrinema litorale TaxID=2994555 RepID=UPI002543859A|nr:efflux RND transporter periplasmic adaptor subunit [Chondrinema litorale]UZR96542.1 efflux RND transporter periplasmic adaptor subunit [Chondrinema litorale]
MKKIIGIVVVLALIGIVAFTLSNNKTEMEETAASLQQKSESIPVSITTLKEEKISGQVDINGTLEPKAELTLMSETQGKVTKLYKRKGDKVAIGTLLLQVDNELIQSQLIAAEAQFEKMQKDVARFEKLIKEDAITERDLEEARLGLKQAEANYKSTKKRLEDTYLKSPINGVIHEDYIEIGSFLSPGTKVYDIVDVSKLKLEVKVPESYILEIQDGQKVEISTDVHPGKTIEGKVVTVAQKADATLKYGVEIEVINNNAELPLKAGMYAIANFQFAPKESLVLERKAISGSLKDATVFVVENETAKVRQIVIGQVFDDKVEVVSGLKKGEKVVLSGQINLKDGTKVSAI